MIILLDFDGTIVEHKFPIIGENNDGWVEIIYKLQQAKFTILLNTVRENFYLDEAYKHIELSIINSEYKDKIKPFYFTFSKILPLKWDLDLAKDSNILYLDDTALNIPLKTNKNGYTIVNWEEIDKQLELNNFYENIF